jgi:putative membrane protein
MKSLTQSPLSQGHRTLALTVALLAGAAFVSAQSSTTGSSSSSKDPSSTSSSSSSDYSKPSSSSSSTTTPSSSTSSTGSSYNSGSSTYQSGTGSSDINASSTSSTTGAGAATGRSTSSDKLSWGDKRFVTKAADGGSDEIAVAELAAQKATNSEVKSFAQKLVDDHKMVASELQGIASQKNVKLDKDSDHDRAYKRLSKKTGSDFDQEFVEHMIDEHEKAIKMFEKAANDAKDTDVRAFAAKHVDHLRDHLKTAEGLRQTLMPTGRTSSTSGTTRSSTGSYDTSSSSTTPSSSSSSSSTPAASSSSSSDQSSTATGRDSSSTSSSDTSSSSSTSKPDSSK